MTQRQQPRESATRPIDEIGCPHDALLCANGHPPDSTVRFFIRKMDRRGTVYKLSPFRTRDKDVQYSACHSPEIRRNFATIA